MPRLERARARSTRSWAAQRWPMATSFRRRAPDARRGVLPLRQVRVRRRLRADEGRAPQGSGMPESRVAADRSSGRAGGDPLRGQASRRQSSQTGGSGQTAGRRDVHGARLDQGGNGLQRERVPRARHGDARFRRARAGRGRVRFRHSRRLRSRGQGRAGFRRDPQRPRRRRASACGAYRWAAITRRAQPRSTSASRRASRCRGRSSGRSSSTGCPS